MLTGVAVEGTGGHGYLPSEVGPEQTLPGKEEARQEEAPSVLNGGK